MNGLFSIEIDAQKSFDYFTKAATMGSSEGHWMLYWAFHDRNKNPALLHYEDKTLALHHLQRAAEGCKCWTDHDCAEEHASQKYRHHGKEETERAICHLATCHENGELGLSIDLVKSFNLFEEVAGTPADVLARNRDLLDGDVWHQSSGKADAQLRLAQAFHFPHLFGLESDDNIAWMYFKAAADNGSERALYEMGLQYEDSITRVDAVQALVMTNGIASSRSYFATCEPVYLTEEEIIQDPEVRLAAGDDLAWNRRVLDDCFDGKKDQQTSFPPPPLPSLLDLQTVPSSLAR